MADLRIPGSLIGIGDNTVDIFVDQKMQFPGGNAVNVAARAARLGVVASYLGCLGTDARGDLIHASLAAEGVDLSHCRRRPGPNSFSCVGHREGDRVFLQSNPGVRYQYDLGAADERFIATHDVTHTSIYSGLAAEMPRIRAASPILSMDLSEHRDRMEVKALLPLLDVVFTSCPEPDDEGCRAIAEHLAVAGPDIVVITRGRRGSMALHRGRCYVQPIVPTELVDTLGAGDALIAAFLAGRLRGSEIADALRQGAENAALSCRSRGAFGHGVPWPPETLPLSS